MQPYSFCIPDAGACCFEGIVSLLKHEYEAQFEMCIEADPVNKRINIQFIHAKETPLTIPSSSAVKALLDNSGWSASEAHNAIQEETTMQEPPVLTEKFIQPPKQKRTIDALFNKTKSFFSSHWVKGGLGLGVGIILLILSFFTAALPLGVMIAIGIVSTILTLALGAPFYKRAFLQLVRARSLTMDTLFAVSTLSIILVSMFAFAFPFLPMMFEAGLLIFGFRHIGQAIESSMKSNLQQDLKFQDAIPQKVKKKDGEQWVLWSTSDIQIGDVLSIEVGAIIPLDGKALTATLVDESTYTGAVMPRDVKSGDLLRSGCYVVPGGDPLELKVTTIFEDTSLVKLDQALGEAQGQKAPTEMFATRVLQYFIPAVIFIALVVGVVVGVFFPLTMAIQCVIMILIGMCPCMLATVPPLTYKLGLHKAADEAGIVFSSHKALAASAEIDTVVFDFNGTLTEGFISVIDAHFDVDLSDKAALNKITHIIKTLEKDEEHPVAKALVQYLDLMVSSPAPSLQVDTLTTRHNGLSAIIDGQAWIIGNADYLKSERLESCLLLDADTERVIYAVCNGERKAYFKLVDALRADAKPCLQSLIAQGKSIYICTGDTQETVLQQIPDVTIPIEHIFSNCSPYGENNGKNTYIQNLVRQGRKVLYVGNGQNDAVAMKEAHASIAITSPQQAFVIDQAASATVTKLNAIPRGLSIAARTKRYIYMGLIANLFYNLGIILLPIFLITVCGFIVNPALGALFMALQVVVILANLYRFKKEPLAIIDSPIESSPKAHPLSLLGGNIDAALNLGPIPPAPAEYGRIISAPKAGYPDTSCFEEVSPSTLSKGKRSFEPLN